MRQTGAAHRTTDVLDRRFGLGEALGGVVLLAIAGTLPEIAITVCGDDDKWNETNAGREKATKAAMIAQAGVIFPAFASDEGKPTDFNDLYVREGVDADGSEVLLTADPLGHHSVDDR